MTPRDQTPLCWQLLLAALLLLGWPPFNQAAEKDGPFYDIEILFFVHTKAQSKEESEPSKPWIPKGAPLYSQGREKSRKYRLNLLWKRLEQSPDYWPLVHLAWRQALPDKIEGEPIRLQFPEATSSASPPVLSGTFSLSRNWFAILKLDLVWREGKRQYPIRNISLLKRNDIYYLDHPRIGILATLTRLSPN